MQRLARIVFKNSFVPSSPDCLTSAPPVLLLSISGRMDASTKDDCHLVCKKGYDLRSSTIWEQCRDLSTICLGRSGTDPYFQSQNPVSERHLSKEDSDSFVNSLDAPASNDFTGLFSEAYKYTPSESNKIKGQKFFSKSESKRLKIEKDVVKQFFASESVIASDFKLFNLTGNYILEKGSSWFRWGAPITRMEKSWKPVPRFYASQTNETGTKKIMHGYITNVGEGIQRRTKQLVGKLRAIGNDSSEETSGICLENPYAGCDTSSDYKSLAPVSIHEEPPLVANIVATDSSGISKETVPKSTNYAMNFVISVNQASKKTNQTTNQRYWTLMQLFNQHKLVSIQPVHNAMLKNWGLVKFFESHQNINESTYVKVMRVPVWVSMQEVLEQKGRSSIKYIGQHSDVGLILIGENLELVGVVPENSNIRQLASALNAGTDHEVSSVTANLPIGHLAGFSGYTNCSENKLLHRSAKYRVNPTNASFNPRFYSDDAHKSFSGIFTKGAKYEGRVVPSKSARLFLETSSSVFNEPFLTGCKSLALSLLADVPGKPDTDNGTNIIVQSLANEECKKLDSKSPLTESKKVDLESMPTFRVEPFEGSADDSLGGAQTTAALRCEAGSGSENTSSSTENDWCAQKSTWQTNRPPINVGTISSSYLPQTNANSAVGIDRTVRFSQPRNNPVDHPYNYPHMPIVCYPKPKHLRLDAQGKIRYPRPCPYQWGPQLSAESALQASVAEYYKTNIPTSAESDASCKTLGNFGLSEATAKSEDLDFESIKTIGEATERVETHSPDSATITSSGLCEQPYSDGHLPEGVGCECPQTQEKVGIRCCPWHSNQPCPQMPDTMNTDGIQYCPWPCDIQCPEINNASSTAMNAEARCCKCSWPCGIPCPRPPINIPDWTEFPESCHSQMPSTPSYNSSYGPLSEATQRFMPADPFTFPQVTASERVSASTIGSTPSYAGSMVASDYYSFGPSPTMSPSNISRGSVHREQVPSETLVSGDPSSGLVSRLADSGSRVSGQSDLLRAAAEATSDGYQFSRYYPSNIPTGYSISPNYQKVSDGGMHAQSFNSPSRQSPSHAGTRTFSPSSSGISPSEIRTHAFSPSPYTPSEHHPSGIHTRTFSPGSYPPQPSYHPSEIHTGTFYQSSNSPSGYHPSRAATRTLPQGPYSSPSYLNEVDRITSPSGYSSGYYPSGTDTRTHATNVYTPSGDYQRGGPLSGYYSSNTTTRTFTPSHHPESDFLRGTKSKFIGYPSSYYSPGISMDTMDSAHYPNQDYSEATGYPAPEHYGSDTSMKSHPLSPFTGVNSSGPEVKAFATSGYSSSGHHAQLKMAEHIPQFSVTFPDYQRTGFQPMPSHPVPGVYSSGPAVEAFATSGYSPSGHHTPLNTVEHSPQFSVPPPDYLRGSFQPMPSHPVPLSCTPERYSRSTNGSYSSFHPSSANVSTSGSCMPCIPCPCCYPNPYPYFMAQREQETIVTPSLKRMESMEEIRKVKNSGKPSKQETFQENNEASPAKDSEPVNSQHKEKLNNYNTKTENDFLPYDLPNACFLTSSYDKCGSSQSSSQQPQDQHSEKSGSEVRSFLPSIKTRACSITVSAQSLEGVLLNEGKDRRDCESVSCSQSPTKEEYQPVPRIPRNLWNSLSPARIFRTMESESRKAKGHIFPEMRYCDPALFRSLVDLGISNLNKASYSGEWIGSGEVVPAIDPATLSCITDVVLPTPAEVEQCIVAVKDAIDVWANFQPPCRSVILREIARRISDKSEQLAKLVSFEVGKIFRDAMCEVRGVVQMFNYAAGLASVLAGNIFESERSGHIIMERFLPLGTTGVITAFNTPFSTFGKSASISLAIGNTVLFKPAPSTALSSIALVKIVGETFKAFGLPPAVVCVQGGSDVGRLVAEDERVDIVAFSGSQTNGHDVGMRVQNRFGKPLLNIAGNNSLIVSHDANFELALDAATVGIVDFAGQKKQKISHIIVHRLLYDQFVEKLVDMMEKVKRFCGNPLDPRSMFGPLHSSQIADEYLRVVQEVREADGLVEVGGRCIRGNFVEPTIVTGVGVNSKLVASPVIGPLAFVFPASNLEEAIEINNSFSNRLNSSVFTKNVVDVYRFIGFNGLSGGVISINTANTGTELTVPLGGDRAAGGGRLSGSNIWQEYCRRVAVNLNFSSSLPYAHGSSCTHLGGFQIY